MGLSLCRTILFVKDMRTMSLFYRDQLGLAAVDESGSDWKVYQAGAIEFALHEVPEPWRSDINIEDPPEARYTVPVKLVFFVENVREARAELEARGVEFSDDGPGNEPVELVRCDLVDPEGNIVQLTSERGSL